MDPANETKIAQPWRDLHHKPVACLHHDILAMHFVVSLKTLMHL